MIKAIIIDDEAAGRDTLAYLLAQYCDKSILLCGMADSVQQGILLIARQTPDLVFLDMEMPSEHGLTLVTLLPDRKFDIIITTAHKNYGIEAVKAGALDYLLKPIDADELVDAVQKVLKKQNAQVAFGQENSTLNKRISLLAGNNKLIYFLPEELIRCESNGNYTTLFFLNGTKEVATKLIKDIATMLDEKAFMRVHKSHLIHLKYVKALLKNDDEILMCDNSKVPISRSEKAEFMERMGI